jgi:hypothetical protein
MSNGSFQIAGVQTGAQSGNTSDPLGPFTIQFTDVSDQVSVNLATGLNFITVPTGAGGVLINPPSGSVVTLLMAQGYINPGSPTYWQFDTVTPNVPGDFTINAGGAVTVVFRFT